MCPRRSGAVRSRTSAGWSRPTPSRSPGWSPARSASRTPRRSARSARSSTPATSSSARAAGSTARRCRARCRTSSCSPSATRSASSASSPPATSRSPSRPGTSIPALLCGNAVVWKPADYSPACGAALFDLFVRGGGLPDGVLNLVLADGEATFAGLEQALDGRLRRQGRLHRLERGRVEDRRAHRPAPAVGLPGARRQEPDGRHPERGPRPRGRGGAVLRLRHRRASDAPRSAP